MLSVSDARNERLYDPHGRKASLRTLIENPARSRQSVTLRQARLELGVTPPRAADYVTARRYFRRLTPFSFHDTDPQLAVRPLSDPAHVRQVEAAVGDVREAAAAVNADDGVRREAAAAATAAADAAAAAAAHQRFPSFWSSNPSAVVELAALGGGVLVALRANGVCVALDAPGVGVVGGGAATCGSPADPASPLFRGGRVFLNAGPLDCVRSVFHARSARCLVLVSMRVPQPGLAGDRGSAGLMCRAVAVEDVVAAVRGAAEAGGGAPPSSLSGGETGAAPQTQAQAQAPLDFTPAPMDLSTWPGMGGSEQGSDSETESGGGFEEEEEEEEEDDDDDDDEQDDDEQQQRKRRRRNTGGAHPHASLRASEALRRRPPLAYVSRVVVASSPGAGNGDGGLPTAARRPRVFSFLAGGGPALRLCSGNELRNPGFVEFHGDHERAVVFEPTPPADAPRGASRRVARPRGHRRTAAAWGPAGRFRVLDLASYPFRAIFSAPAFPGEICKLSAELLVTLRVEDGHQGVGGGGGGGWSAVSVAPRGAALMMTTAPVAPWVDPFRDTSLNGGRRRNPRGADKVVVVTARDAATGRLLSEHRLPAGASPPQRQLPAIPFQMLELLSGACIVAKSPLSPLCFLDAVSLAVRAACFDALSPPSRSARLTSPLFAEGVPGPDPGCVFLAHPTRPLVVALGRGGGPFGGDSARSWSTLSAEPLTHAFSIHAVLLPGGAVGVAHEAADTNYLSGRLDALVSLCRASVAARSLIDGKEQAVCASCVLTGLPLGRVDPWSAGGGSSENTAERRVVEGVTAVLARGGDVFVGNAQGLVGVWGPGGLFDN